MMRLLKKESMFLFDSLSCLDLLVSHPKLVANAQFKIFVLFGRFEFPCL
jgi:hypothetical protein